MGFFESLPQIASSSNAYVLSNEVVGSDSLNIFLWAIISGLSVGIFLGILMRVTKWVWK